MQEAKNKEESTEKIVQIGPSIIGQEHEFDYVSGTEVMCRKCPLGYILGPEYTVKNGHIYRDGQLMI